MLFQMLDTAKGSSRITVLNELCYQFAFKNPERAIKYGSESLKLAMQNNDSLLLAAAYNDLSIPYFLTGDFTRMLELNRKALQIRKSIGDSMLIAASYSKMGNALQEMGKLDSTLYYYNEALKIYQQKGNKQYQSQLLNNISNIYERLGDYEGAIELHDQVASIALELRDSTTYLQVMGNHANTLDKLERYAEARRLYFELIPLTLKLGFNEYLGNIYLGLGTNYKSTNDLQSALLWYKKAFDLYRQLNSITAMSVTATNIGKTYTVLMNSDSASIFLNIGLEYGLLTRSFTNIFNAYNGLKDLENARSNYQKALEYSELAKIYEDSLFTERVADKISEFRIAYQTEKKEKELAENKLELESRKRAIIYIIFSGAGIVFFMTFLYFRKHQKHQLEIKQALLDEKQKGLGAVIYAQEEERKRLAKELHDGIAQTLGMLKFAFSGFRDLFNPSSHEYTEYTTILNQLEEANQEIRNVSHQMMPRALEELGLVAALSDLAEKTGKYSDFEIEYEVFGIDQDERFSQSIEISLYRIAQELINNVLKHSKATKASVSLRKTKTFLVLTCEDNGTGNTIIDNQGIGLMNIRSRAENINGSFHIESSGGIGTSATIRIPL